MKRAQVAGEQLRAVSRAWGCPPSSGLSPQLGAVSRSPGCPPSSGLCPELRAVPPGRGRGCPSTSTPASNPVPQKLLHNYCKVRSKALEALASPPELLCFPCPAAHWEAPWLHLPRARALPTKCHRDSWLESITGTKQPWEGPRAPSSMEKTSATELSRDAKSRADPGSLPCPQRSVAVRCHQGEATGSTGAQVCGGTWGGGILGQLFHVAPAPQSAFPARHPLSRAHPERPVPVPTRAPGPALSRAELLFPPDPPQVLKIAAGALTHASHPPSEPAAAPGAGSARVPLCATPGWARRAGSSSLRSFPA